MPSDRSTAAPVQRIPVAQVRFVKELYPRLKPHDDAIERYRDALDNLPPITTARGDLLVDGYHRWQAFQREGVDTIPAEDLGNLTDAEIIRESVHRNAAHGQQLTRADKRRMAEHLWAALGHLPAGERVADIAGLLAVSERAVHEWTRDARAAEKRQRQDRAWDMWLDCHTQQRIADELGMTQQNVALWIQEIADQRVLVTPPESRQHYDLWTFPTADQDAGQPSYFGATPPQLVENLLWYFTQPGDIVVDLFAGSGTTVEVCKRMGRRVWAADIRGNHSAPYLPIHTWDVNDGWPPDAPRKAKLVFLDPPYWRQARGRYSDQPGELAELDLDGFETAWRTIAKTAMGHAQQVAYLVSPSTAGDDDGTVVDHAARMWRVFDDDGWAVRRRIIVPYQTQQWTGAQVEQARDAHRMLQLYRDLVVLAA